MKLNISSPYKIGDNSERFTVTKLNLVRQKNRFRMVLILDGNFLTFYTCLKPNLKAINRSNG